METLALFAGGGCNFLGVETALCQRASESRPSSNAAWGGEGVRHTAKKGERVCVCVDQD